MTGGRVIRCVLRIVSAAIAALALTDLVRFATSGEYSYLAWGIGLTVGVLWLILRSTNPVLSVPRKERETVRTS